jgi:glycerol-3-phosphate dehydrogenase subunit B
VTALVIGGGFAGIAAAWALSRRRRDVLVVWEGPGASAFYPGTLDRVEWGGLPDPRPLATDVESFLAALGAFAPSGNAAARVATSAGVLRPARCRDRALLDLEPLRGRRIDVVDFGRPGWDAATLARAWSETAWARQSRTRFRSVVVDGPDGAALRGLPPGELAARFDDPSWVASLAPALLSAGDGESPLLLGPWLGTVPGSVERLRELLRRPIGETLSDPGGAAGLRYEAARDAWLARAGIEVRATTVRSVRHRGERYEVLASESEGAAATPLGQDIREVILAIGGVVGGGIRFLAGAGPEGRSFSLSLEAPVALRLAGKEVSLQSGALGVDLQRWGLEALQEVGLAVDEQSLARAPDLYAVGDVVADRPRCVLDAIYSGLGAARAVCRVRAPAVSP